MSKFARPSAAAITPTTTALGNGQNKHHIAAQLPEIWADPPHLHPATAPFNVDSKMCMVTKVARMKHATKLTLANGKGATATTKTATTATTATLVALPVVSATLWTLDPTFECNLPPATVNVLSVSLCLRCSQVSVVAITT